MSKGTILSLCDYTGSWPQPYLDAGYDVIQIDIKHGSDVLELATDISDLPAIRGILAAPPCTDFSVSGAQYWQTKDKNGRTDQSIAIVRACLSIITQVKPVWWALENPVGRIAKLVPELGKPAFKFDPCDFGDPYTKRTYLWGRFVLPLPLMIGGDWSVEPIRVSKQGSWIQTLGGKSERTKELRSVTPPGFARAFCIANP